MGFACCGWCKQCILVSVRGVFLGECESCVGQLVLTTLPFFSSFHISLLPKQCYTTWDAYANCQARPKSVNYRRLIA